MAKTTDTEKLAREAREAVQQWRLELADMLTRDDVPLSDVFTRCAAALDGAPAAPLDMVIRCPHCGTQHIDKAEPESGWDNPPHTSHLCHNCGAIWRDASVPTNGVASVPPGKHDRPPAKAPPAPDTAGLIERATTIAERLERAASSPNSNKPLLADHFREDAKTIRDLLAALRTAAPSPTPPDTTELVETAKKILAELDAPVSVMGGLIVALDTPALRRVLEYVAALK